MPRASTPAPGLPAPPYRAAALAALAVLILYAATLAPTSTLWDASEYITAAYVLGIPHPPGNPLFVLVGNVAAHLPIPGTTPALRVNLLAAAASALAAGVWFLVTERVLAHWLMVRWQRIAGASAAALVGATTFTVWSQSVVNEKVYTVSLAIFAVVAWLVVRWCDEPGARRADAWLLLVAYLIGLGYANHPAGLLPLPAVAIAVLAHAPRTLLRWRLMLACAGMLAIGLTPFATQPIRAAHFPVMNMGEPTGCTERIGWSCTFSRTTWERLMANVNREQYGKPSLTERQAPLTAQVGMWWLYFRWQWLRDAYGERPVTQHLLAVAFLSLGLFGGWTHRRRDPRSFWFFGPLVGTLTLGLVVYLNFRYGHSQAPWLQQVEREVRDRDYFYLWSFSTWSVWVAVGLVALWQRAAGALAAMGARRIVRSPHRAALLTAPILLVASIPLVANRTQAPRTGETVARDFAHDLLDSVEPYGILITAGDNDTFPLWYAQEVEGIRRDVTVAVTSLLNTDWYVRGLIRRPVHRYDPERGPAVYRDRSWPVPDRPVLDLTIAEADAVPLYLAVPEPQLFVEGEIRAVVDPRRLQYGVIERADLLVLRMIRDNAGRRPIHFSRTSGGYPSALGLADFTLAQGMTRKLLPRVPAAGVDTLPMPGDGHFDVARTAALWDLFRGGESIVARGEWPDRASVGIAATYVITGLELAEAMAVRGDTASARQIADTAYRIAAATRITDWFRSGEELPPQIPTDAPRRELLPIPSGE